MAATVQDFAFSSEDSKSLLEEFMKCNPAVKNPTFDQVITWLDKEEELCIRADRREQRAQEKEIKKAKVLLEKTRLDVEKSLIQTKLDDAKLGVTMSSTLNTLMESQCKAMTDNAGFFNKLAQFRAITSVMNMGQLWKF